MSEIDIKLYLIYDILQFIYDRTVNQGAFQCVTSDDILTKFNTYNLNYKKISAIMSLLTDGCGVGIVYKKINNKMFIVGWNVGWNYKYMEVWQNIIKQRVYDKKYHLNF